MKSTWRCPTCTTPTRAENEVGKTAQLYFYDWEPNVIGPDGKPAPTEATVTGGAEARPPDLRADRVPGRAARRQTPARSARERHHLEPGAARPNRPTAASTAAGTCSTPRTKRCSARRRERPRETEANLYAEGYKVPTGAETKAVRVNPGTVLVQARPVESAAGKVTNPSPNSWYVLNDDPVLTGSDITNPQRAPTKAAAATAQPNVTFGFTGHGKSIFERSPRKSPTAVRKPSCPASPRKPPSSTSRSCSTAS